MANGIMTNSELITSLIADLNSVLKAQMTGQYIQACNYVTQMGQKLINLRDRIDDDLKNREETIEQLKQELRDAGATVTDVSPEGIEKIFGNGGADNGK